MKLRGDQGEAGSRSPCRSTAEAMPRGKEISETNVLPFISKREVKQSTLESLSAGLACFDACFVFVCLFVDFDAWKFYMMVGFVLPKLSIDLTREGPHLTPSFRVLFRRSRNCLGFGHLTQILAYLPYKDFYQG